MNMFPRQGRPNGNEPTDLSQVQADDALIESIRTTPVFDNAYDGHPADGPLVDDAMPVTRADLIVGRAAFGDRSDRRTEINVLLRDWRNEINSVPLPPPIDLQVATSIIASAPRRRRALRPMIAVACAIVGLLVGSAAIGARSATPGNALWPVTQVLWGDRADSVLAAIDVRKGIEKASGAIEAHEPDAAEAALSPLTTVITRVQERDGAEGLKSDLTKVQSQLEDMTSAPTAPSTSDSDEPTDDPTSPSSSSSSTPSTTSSPSSTTSSTTSSTSTSSTHTPPQPPPPASDDPTTPDTTPTDPTTPDTSTSDTSTSPSDTSTSDTTSTTSSTSSTETTTSTTDTTTSTTETSTSISTTPGSPQPPAGNAEDSIPAG